MNKKELQQIIKLGEGFNSEFKKSFSAGIGKEICAFANSLGGKIFVGVDDKGNISGIKNKNRIKSLIQSISRNMEPSYSVDIETVDNVLVVYVPDGNKKPYSVGGKFFIREGSNSQQLSRDEIREFFFKENLIYWDQKLNMDFHPDKDFSEKRYDTFVRRAKIPKGLDTSDVLKNLNILRNEGFCNAGVLIFCEKVTRFFLSATITCVLFQGNTKYKILDRKEFDGDIFSNYRSAMNYLLSHLNTEFIIKGGPREEKLELPEEALREALLNAIGHRDYRSTSNIQVYIFNDRVEIINPGGLVSGLKKEDLGKVSRPRNPLLFNLMYRMDLVEQIGSGILRINNAMTEYDMSSPDIESDNDWYSISFKRSLSKELAISDRELLDKSGQESRQESRQESDVKLRIMDVLKTVTLSRSEIAKELGHRSVSGAVNRAVAKLRSDGLIEYTIPEKPQSRLQRYMLTDRGRSLLQERK